MPKLQSLFLIGHAHPALPGHFPDAPIVPGVMVLDQVLTRLREHLGFDPVLLELPQVKFIEPLLPGSVAAIEIEIEAARARFRVQRDDVMIANGSVHWQVPT